VTTTTTTAAPTTTTTVAVQPKVDDPATTEAGTNSAPAVEPAPAVIGEVAVAPAPMPQLPRTGSGIDVLAGFGAAAVALGGLTRFLGRRRPAEG
jgi:LPXTG-motif cell wall-anchored protein